MEETKNIGLIKQGVNEFYDINVTNKNMEKIDQEFGKVNEINDRMGVMPIDGGTFFETYIDWSADAGTF